MKTKDIYWCRLMGWAQNENWAKNGKCFFPSNRANRAISVSILCGLLKWMLCLCVLVCLQNALNPWIIIIYFFLSLSPSTESPSHICSTAISAAQTRIHCSFNNYFYLTPGQRTSIPMIPSKCWTLLRRQTENMTNNPRSGWRPFGCLLRDSMRDIMNIFIWSYSWQEKLSFLSAVCCCFLWRMVVCFEEDTQRKKAHDVC